MSHRSWAFEQSYVLNQHVTGTAGSGYTSYVTQTTVPTTPPTGIVKIYANDTPSGITRMSMITSSGTSVVFFRDMVDTIRNETGVALTKGQVVYYNGSNGTTPTVALAKADSASTAAAVGLVLPTTLGNNSFGTIIKQGVFTGLNTVAYSPGDTLWLSASSAGAITNVQPTSPDLSIRIGVVVTSSANGIINLHIQTPLPLPLENAEHLLINQVFDTPSLTFTYADQAAMRASLQAFAAAQG